MNAELKYAFRCQRQNARNRSIPFLLTFEQWIAIWEASGHLHQRGRRKGDYVMARHGDIGAYEDGNVKIIHHTANVSERHLGRAKPPCSEETRKKLSENEHLREHSTCPHCGKTGSGPMMQRWHFDNCRPVEQRLDRKRILARERQRRYREHRHHD